MNSKRVVLAGGNGFIGTALADEFVRRGYEVIVLTRQPKKRPGTVQEVAWDGKTESGDWGRYLDGAEAVINLSGKNINCRHTTENLEAITSSRVNSVNAIRVAIAQVEEPPQTWVQASATRLFMETQEIVCAMKPHPMAMGFIGDHLSKMGRSFF